MFSNFTIFNNDLFNDRFDKIINKDFSVFDNTEDLYSNNIDYNLETDKDKAILSLAMPGFDKSEIEVTYADDVLHITATKEKETALVHNIDTDFTCKKKYSEVKAKYDAGILTITLIKQKTPESQIVTVDWPAQRSKAPLKEPLLYYKGLKWK